MCCSKETVNTSELEFYPLLKTNMCKSFYLMLGNKSYFLFLFVIMVMKRRRMTRRWWRLGSRCGSFMLLSFRNNHSDGTWLWSGPLSNREGSELMGRFLLTFSLSPPLVPDAMKIMGNCAHIPTSKTANSFLKWSFPSWEGQVYKPSLSPISSKTKMSYEYKICKNLTSR